MRKKILILFILSLSICTFSQTYSFDYLIKYEIANHKNGFSESNDKFVSSKESYYFGRFSPTIDKKGYNLIIYDHKNNLTHTFRIEKNESPSDASKYVYMNSGYILPSEKLEKTQKAQIYTHTFIEDIPGGKRMILRKFKNEKAKKPDVEMIADFIEIESDLRPFFYEELFNTRADLVKISDGEKYYLKDGEWKVLDSKGEYHTNIFKVPLILVLDPKKIKLPKEKPKSSEEIIEELKKTIRWE